MADDDRAGPRCASCRAPATCTAVAIRGRAAPGHAGPVALCDTCASVAHMAHLVHTVQPLPGADAPAWLAV